MDFNTVLICFGIAIFAYILVDRICATVEHIAIAKYMPRESKNALDKMFNEKTQTMAFKISKDGKSTPCDLEGNPVESVTLPDVPPEVFGAVADHFRVLKAQKEDELEKERYKQNDED